MRSRIAGLALVVALSGAVGAGCGGSAEDGVSRDAQLYVAAIREVLAVQPPPPEPDVLPVVFVVGVGETKIPAEVQAEVAVELDDYADIRFADARDEAILEDQEHAPVRDEGVLLAVGELPGGDDEQMDTALVDVEVYRSDQDSSSVVLTIARRSSHWAVTSSSVLGPAES
jgi:hypothetical protein